MTDPETAAYNEANAEAQAKIATERCHEPGPLGIGAMAKPPQTAYDVQAGGDHYKNLAIQPMQIALANNLSAWEYDALKYLLRWRHKEGKLSLHKCIHCLQMGLEHEFPDKGADQCLTPHPK